jgi:hypothetical protein
LRVAGERFPEGEIEPGSPMAEAMMQQAALSQPSSGEGDPRIVAYLRDQLAAKERETQALKQHAQQVEAQAEERVAEVYDQATEAVKKVEARRAEAEKQVAEAQAQAQQRGSYLTTVSINAINQFFGRLVWLIAFLTYKLPALGALFGGYLLWSSVLPSPTTPGLIALGLYGALIVLPTIWLATAPQRDHLH